MVGIGGAIVLDEARRLDDTHDLGIELIALKAIPGNVVERPRSHAASRRQSGAVCLYTNEWSAVKSPEHDGASEFSAGDFGQCLELGLGDALLPFELAQFGQEVLA